MQREGKTLWYLSALWASAVRNGLSSWSLDYYSCHFPKIEMSKAEFFCKSA